MTAWAARDVAHGSGCGPNGRGVAERNDRRGYSNLLERPDTPRSLSRRRRRQRTAVAAVVLIAVAGGVAYGVVRTGALDRIRAVYGSGRLSPERLGECHAHARRHGLAQGPSRCGHDAGAAGGPGHQRPVIDLVQRLPSFGLLDLPVGEVDDRGQGGLLLSRNRGHPYLKDIADFQ